MKGGGLVSSTGVKIDLKSIPSFEFLDGYTRTKSGFNVYTISIDNTIEDYPIMTWIPKAGAALQGASYVKNMLVKGVTFGKYGRTPLEEFKQNITTIYKQDLVHDSSKLSELSDISAKDTVILNKTGIKIGDVFYNTKEPLTATDFKNNVVNMYKALTD